MRESMGLSKPIGGMKVKAGGLRSQREDAGPRNC